MMHVSIQPSSNQATLWAALLSSVLPIFIHSGCTDPVTPIAPAILSRPTAITFTCVGDAVIDAGTDQQQVVFGPQPVELCRQWNRVGTDEAPPGQEFFIGKSFNRPSLLAFVLQSDNGTLALLQRDVGNVIIDADPLTPGKNAIPIGTLPIASGADQSGCFVLSANAGTCDLSALDVNSAQSLQISPQIRRIALKNAQGDVLDAKPRAMAMAPQSTEYGNQCPQDPTGMAYVALPDCNLVAAVDVSTGTITGGIRFHGDGSASIVDGNVSCRSQCGGDLGDPPDAGPGPDASDVDASGIDAGVDASVPPPPSDGDAPRPVTVAVDTSSGQLIIGSENSPAITIVSLNANGQPMAKRSVNVEGDVGITKLKVSDEIPMGGNTGGESGPAGRFQFIYAIATDSTIRVVDLSGGVECDTQVDPRYLHDETNIAFLSCMPVGGPDTPPRRPFARSPGIPTPRHSAPLDVEFATVSRAPDVAGPADLAGTFAFVTTSDSLILVVNIDDDVYSDFESTNDPESTFISQAIAHQLRDFVQRSSSAPGFDPAGIRRSCATAVANPQALPPRLSTGIIRAASAGQLSSLKFHEAPSPLNVQCDITDDNGMVSDSVFVSEMALAAPVDLREKTFPDLAAVRNEQWVLTWEGGLSRDSGATHIDGQPIRAGVFVASGTNFVVNDQSKAFCSVGVEKFDLVEMFGCDPTQGDAQCGIDETCFVHPDTPSAVPFGTCLPSDQTEILGAQCRDFLISRKIYSTTHVKADQLELRTRRRVLDTTPLAGCESAAQCKDMALIDRLIANDAHPIEANLPAPEREFSWVCETDPSRAPSVPKCMMSCETSADCEDGLSCEDNFCVFGPVPPAQCMATLQRFRVRASEAFTVIGTQSGYIHNRIVDPTTGDCIDNPSGNPLLVGRIPLHAEPCVGDGSTDLSPNPCQVQVTQKEMYFPYQVQGGRCELPPGDGMRVARERTVDAIRFSNPSMRFHLVDLSTTGDAQCRNDRAGTAPAYSGVHSGFELGIDLTGGFSPMFVRAQVSNNPNPVPVPVRFPIAISQAFDGNLWILDQGDTSSAVQGRVIVINPSAAANDFDPQIFDR